MEPSWEPTCQPEPESEPDPEPESEPFIHFWGFKIVLEPTWPPGSSRGPPASMGQISFKAEEEWWAPLLLCLNRKLDYFDWELLCLIKLHLAA